MSYWILFGNVCYYKKTHLLAKKCLNSEVCTSDFEQIHWQGCLDLSIVEQILFQCRSPLLGRIMKYGVWYVCVVTDNSAPEHHPPPFPSQAQWTLCLVKKRRSVCWKGVLNRPGCLNCCLSYSGGGGGGYQRIYQIKWTGLPQAVSWIVHCILQFSWKDFQFYKPAKIVELMLLFNRWRMSNIQDFK